MAPKLSPVQIDQKLERLHKFACDNIGLLANRNGASLRACLRQTASADERTWYHFLCKNAFVFSDSQNDRVRLAYILLEEQWSSVAPRAAVLPEPAAGTPAVLAEPVVEAAVLPEPAAEALELLPTSTPEAAAVLPDIVTEAAIVQTAPEEPDFPPHKKARSLVPTDVLAPLQTGPVLKAVDFLEAMPARRGLVRLHHVLQQW